MPVREVSLLPWLVVRARRYSSTPSQHAPKQALWRNQRHEFLPHRRLSLRARRERHVPGNVHCEIRASNPGKFGPRHAHRIAAIPAFLASPSSKEGEVWVRRLLAMASCFQNGSGNGLKDSVSLFEHISVGEPQHADTQQAQLRGPGGISIFASCRTVAGTVNLYSKPQRGTVEVENESTDRVLPAKFVTFDLAGSQERPQNPLCVGLSRPQTPPQTCGTFGLLHAGHYSHSISGAPTGRSLRNS